MMTSFKEAIKFSTGVCAALSLAAASAAVVSVAVIKSMTVGIAVSAKTMAETMNGFCMEKTSSTAEEEASANSDEHQENSEN